MSMPPVERLARTVALAVIIAIGIFNLYIAVTNWTLSDAGAYWQAGLRLRAGEALYPALTSAEGSEIYRYAPWFAWLAVPWTFLPEWLAGLLWSAVLLGASALALLPLVRLRAWILMAFFGPILVGISAVGNVQPLIVAALVLGVERRCGPLWIALAGSLKIFPLLLALVYAGRRQWWAFAATVAITALLWLPAFVLYDLGSYPASAGEAGALIAFPVVYFAVVGIGIGATFALAPTRWGWLAGATTVIASLPRLFVYDVTYLMIPSGQLKNAQPEQRKTAS
ncbi:MAG TPA: hypothetical protein VFY43_08485 [Candidatus Limnocylindria bacterium]|nr:hypothetical protein [Candidatus Limnocylindria bacterium]